VTTREVFITRRPVMAYFVLTFAISWGGFLLAGGPGIFAGTSWQTDPPDSGPAGALADLSGVPARNRPSG
jgi:hypothetical protein